MSSQPYDDPFATPDKHPAVSFKDKPVGTRYTCKVTDRPTQVQTRDYDTGEKAWWNAEKTEAKMAVVTGVEIDGEPRALWAPFYPPNLFNAIKAAQAEAGAQLDVGGTLVIEFVGEEPNEKNPRLNPAKLYRAHYTPPSVFAGGVPSGSPATQVSEPPF